MAVSSIRYTGLQILACCVWVLYYAYGVESYRLLPKQEELDLEIEMQLKRLNKPAIKTIQTKHGDIYDCVNFYNQPAFDHPLLKNYTAHHEIRPSSVPKIRMDNSHPTTNLTDRHIGISRVHCPIGTVPIKRVTKDDLKRARPLDSSKYGCEGMVYMPTEDESTSYDYVLARTNTDPNKQKYIGGGAAFSIYPLNVSYGQYNQARIKLQSGSDSVKVGVMIHPTFYGDQRPRLFIRTDTRSSSCFNLQCSGFIQVNSEIPVDAIVDPLSKQFGPTYSARFFLHKDPISGNWWYLIDNARTPVGYWPKSMFQDGLQDMATSLEWGGEVCGPSDKPSAPMGHGDFVRLAETAASAYIGLITIVNEDDEEKEARQIEFFDPDSPKFYNHYDKGYVGADYGRLVFYGGPGGAMEE